jgi:hypothetical protein
MGHGCRKARFQSRTVWPRERSMKLPFFISNASCDSSDSFSPEQAGTLTTDQEEVLTRALAKVVVLGEEIGVTTDQMIRMLDSGMSVRELLEYLVTLAEK